MRAARAFGCFVLLGAGLWPFDTWGQAGAPASQAPPATSANLEAARALAREGLAFYEAGQPREAIDRFQKADALFPAQQYRVYIGRAYVKLGRVATAARFYEKATAMPMPANAPKAATEAQQIAVAELEDIRRRVPSLQVFVTGPPREAIQMTLDGATVSPTYLRNVELDPGPHVLEASAPGFEPQTQTVELREGGVQRVGMVLKWIAPPAPPVVSSPPALVEPVPLFFGVPGRISPVDSAPPVVLSHRRQFGALVRADIDPIHAGVVFAPGLTFGATNWLEVGASGLIGNEKGVEPDVRFFVLRGAWKPLVNVGVPIFFADGARVGVRGAAGVQWDPIRHFGVFVQVGGAYFVNAQEGHAKALFLPSAGVQARL